MVKIIGIVGSPPKGGNTEYLIGEALKAAEGEGVKTEIITLADKEIKPCNGCGKCRRTGVCHVEDDLKPILKKIVKADGIILASPVYFGSATPQIKALIDRAGASSSKYRLLENKVGGAIVVARRAGHNFTLAQIVLFFLMTAMIVPGSTYWTIAFRRNKGDSARDEEGLRHIRNLGKKIAWLTRIISTRR